MKKKLAAFLAVLPLLIFIALYIYFAYNPEKALGRHADESSSESEAAVSEMTLPDGEYEEDSEDDAQEDESGQPRQRYALIPVKHISQNPELPTGCEVTSLTMVLNYLGFDVDKSYMADRYLDKLNSFDGSFYDYFIGDPSSPDGFGCFAPAITRCANRYLTDNASSLKAFNISGAPLKRLFGEILDGNPVIVWTTSNWETPVTYTDIWLNNNSVFKWPNNEHCVVLIGFNLEKNTVFLADPLSDIVERDLSEFAETYSSYYKQAVVIRKPRKNAATRNN